MATYVSSLRSHTMDNNGMATLVRGNFVDNDYMNKSRIPIVLTNQLNPLSMDHVLETIFGYMEKEHLFKMRLVSRQWNWNARSVLTRKLNEIVFGQILLKDFLEFWKKKSYDSLFVKFKVFPTVLTEENSGNLRQLMEMCGPSMECLSIWPGWLKRTKDYPTKNFTMYLPKLKTLNVGDPLWNFQPGRHIDTIFLESVVKSSPNITSFSFTMTILGQGTVDKDNKLRNDLVISLLKSMINLKTLKLEMVLNDQFFASLNTLNLQLRNLYLVFSFLPQSNFERNCFSLFLNSQRNTLKQLCIFGLDDIQFRIYFPSMPSLTCLEIDGNIPMNRTKFQPHLEKNRIELSKFSYNKNFPQLKRLILSTWAKNEYWKQFFSADDSACYMEKLQLPYYFRDINLAQKIPHCFPRLKILELIYSPEIIPILETIFETMDSIEDLKLLHCLPRKLPIQNIDHLLTGIPKEECHRIRTGRIYNLPSAGKTCCKPSIVNLTRLKRLDLSEMLTQAEISDVTVFLAFFKMETLEMLHIQRSKIEEKSLCELASRLTLKLN